MRESTCSLNSRQAVLVAGLILCVTFSAVATPVALGDQDAPVPLLENFSPLELTAVSALTATAATLFVFNDRLALQMGDPWFGDPGPLDLAVTNALFLDGDPAPWLGGWPDMAGDTLAPGVAVLYYVGNGVTGAIRGTSLTGSRHAVHEMVAFAEAFSATATLTFTTKLLVGRERPLYALERYPGTTPEPDAYQSFFSGHASTSFCIAAFVTRDVGDWLMSGPLEARSGVPALLLGRLIPGTVLYGAAAVVGISRIVDQKHYLSDVLVGAAVGTVFGNLFYALHFDRSGEPRRRHRALVTTFGFGPASAWVSGRF